MADAWYLKFPDNATSQLVQISGVSSSVSVGFTLAEDSLAFMSNRYIFDIRRNFNNTQDAGGTGFFLQQSQSSYDTTGIRNLKVNGLISNAQGIFSAVEDDFCEFTVNNTVSNGVFAFGARFNEVESFKGLAVKNIIVTDSAGVHTINMTDSGGTLSEFTSTDGIVTLKLFNFPTDGSQWELYDDGTGSADTTITGAFSFLPFEFSGNASATLPQPISNSAFDLPELIIAGAQSASLPQPELTGAFSFNALDFSGTQSSSLPQPITNASFELPEFSVSGDISASLPDNTITSTGAFSFAPFEFSGAQSSTQPQPTSDAAFDLPILTLLATQSASLPQPTVSGAFTLPALTINGSMSLGIPQPIVNGSFELPGFTFSGSGSATFPQPTISGSFELPAITVLGSVSLSGVVINVENSGIIILQAGESSIQLSAGDSLIYLH